MDWSLFFQILAQLVIACVVLAFPIGLVLMLWTSAARRSFSSKGTKTP